MRFCSFSDHGEECFGFEIEEGILVDLKKSARFLLQEGILTGMPEHWTAVTTLRGWLELGPGALELGEKIREALLDLAPEERQGTRPQNDVRLLAPIPRPGKIAAVGLNYRAHAEEQGRDLPERPLIFAKFPTSVIGPYDPIKLPPVSAKVDPEAELCLVVLETCRRVQRSEVPSRVGLMVGNDVSARDLQYADKQWVRGKSCDTFAPCGPFIATGEDAGDPHDLSIQLQVNDEVRQSGHTSDLIFDCYELVEFLSQTSTLEPGDLIFTGTPAGVGVFRDPPVFLEPGDLVSVQIEGLGTLTNPVVAG